MGNLRQPIVSRWLPATLLLSVVLLLSGCRTSKPAAVKGGSGKKSEVVVTPPTDYDEMRREVGQCGSAIDAIATLISEAASWLGVPYRYGGHDRSGTDCSGMVMEVFNKVLGAKLPRSSRDQQESCTPVTLGDILPGDLVFFATGRDPNRTSHVGLYIGNNEIIHASSSRGVIVSNLSERYYSQRFNGAGRHNSIGTLYADAGASATPSAPVSPPQPAKVQPTPPPATAPATPSPEQLLDDMITEQLDSIYSGFFD